jgi:hypothetical protein
MRATSTSATLGGPSKNFDAAEHQHPANIGGWKDGWEARGVYVNNFVFVPKGV